MGEETTMVSRLVVIKLDGDLETHGFQVTLDVAQEEPFSSISFPQLSKGGYLPPNPELAASLSRWAQDYGDFTGSNRSQQYRALTPYKMQMSGSINPLLEVCKTSSDALATLFRNWLRTDSFRDIEMALREVLDRQSAIRVLIRTQAYALHLLPWHLWSLIQDYPNAEVAMGAHQFDERQNLLSSIPEKKIHILAVLGNDENIDVGADRRLLDALPGAQVTLLVKPTLEIFNDQLYEKRWDILFFAGHSDTTDGQGILQLNSDTMLTISQVEYGVRRAIANGLQLAIFNSCSGVGLAYALEKLDLPQMIVMRQAVPDHVAHAFLKHFLKAFSRGCSFYQAEREARERLQGLEQDFPCASWLPVIYQHPAKIPPSWQQLQDPAHFDSPPSTRSKAQPKPSISKRIGIPAVAIATILTTSLVVGVRQLGLLQNWELKAYDHLMQMRPGQDIADERILIVAVSEEDIQYQRNQGMEMEGSLSDEALLMLLQKISPYNPSVIGLDIIHDFPFRQDLRMPLSNQNLIAICRVRNITSQLAGVAPPPDTLSISQLGFSNIPRDPDDVIRRQFFGKQPDEICPSEESFSFRIAQAYLDKKEGLTKDWSLTPSGEIQQISLGSQGFKHVEKTAGGYKLLSEDVGGYQILVNYRSVNPEQVQLRNILSGSMDSQLSELVRDRIILIGVVEPQVDTHLTPYNNGTATGHMSGVVVHSHMISTVISTTLKERALIWWWTDWWESLWIFSWSLVGATMTIIWRSPYLKGLSISAILIMLWLACFILLIQGWWVPLIPTAIVLGSTVTSTMIIRRAIEHKKH